MESTIRIERYADQGRCVGHIDGRVVFVRFALPGELVRAGGAGFVEGGEAIGARLVQLVGR